MTINTNSSITETPTTNKDIKILDIRVCAGHGIDLTEMKTRLLDMNIPEFTGCYGITV